MTIINDEFFTIDGTITLRVSGICYVDINGWVKFRDNAYPMTPAEAVLLRDHWIRVISARMGIYHEPVVVPSPAPLAQVERDDAEHYGPNVMLAMKRYGWTELQFEELIDWRCRFDPGITKRQRVARVNVTERAVLEDLRNGYDAFCVARKSITEFGDGFPT